MLMASHIVILNWDSARTTYSLVDLLSSIIVIIILLLQHYPDHYRPSKKKKAN
jgi:hypothetical protein